MMIRLHCLREIRLFSWQLVGTACLLLVGLLAPLGVAQQGQKPPPLPPPPPPRTESVFERLERARERQERQDARAAQRRIQLANAERRESLSQLRQDLPRLRRLLFEIQRELRQTDTGNVLSVGLYKKGDELEKLAKRVRKNIRKL